MERTRASLARLREEWRQLRLEIARNRATKHLGKFAAIYPLETAQDREVHRSLLRLLNVLAGDE